MELFTVKLLPLNLIIYRKTIGSFLQSQLYFILF